MTLPKQATALALFTLLTAALPFAAHAGEHEGGANGGGGAGICINGKCIGLAEAGFRIQRSGPGFEISAATINELDVIAAKFPQFDISADAVIGGRDTVTLVEVDQSGKAKRFLEQYKKMLKAHGDASVVKRTSLLGFTLDKKTFLFAQAFAGHVDPRSQALLLIHEKAIRNGATQEQAVRFDGLLIDSLAAMKVNAPIDRWNLLVAARDAHLIGEGQADWDNKANRFLFSEILLNQGRQIFSETDLFGLRIIKSESHSPAFTVLNYQSLLRARPYAPLAAADIPETKVTLESLDDSGPRGFYKRFLTSIMKKFAASKSTEKGIRLSQADLDNFRAKENAFEKKLDVYCRQFPESTPIIIPQIPRAGVYTELNMVTCASGLSELDGDVVSNSWIPDTGAGYEDRVTALFMGGSAQIINGSLAIRGTVQCGVTDSEGAALVVCAPLPSASSPSPSPSSKPNPLKPSSSKR